jgi:hypothetical protein
MELVMVESVTASLIAGIIVVVLLVMATVRGVKRRARAREADAMLEAAEHDETRTKRAG